MPTAQPPDSTAPGPRLVTDELSGSPVVITASRQTRPNLPSTGCPFCPGGLEAPDPYDVRWFPNRWPALGTDRCEVVLYTPDHDASFWSLGITGARKVIDLWAERTAALGALPDVDYVLIFENRGPEVGATIAHPHGQIYAFDSVPPVAMVELESGHLDLPDADSPLVIGTAGDWVAWVPQAATYPYELRIGSRGEVGALTDEMVDRDSLAAVLVDALARLDQNFGEATPYMMWIHQRPTDGRDWPTARLHFHIAPLRRSPGVTRFVAAGELGSGVFFNPVDPLNAAADLRAQDGAQ